MNIRRSLGRVAAGAVLLTATFGVQSALTAPPSPPSSVITVDPARILDTRQPTGVPAIAPVGPAGSITVQVTGVGGVPANATGVIVTLTGTGATTATFVTATPTGTPRSTTSVLNVTPGQDIANTVTMALGTGGKIDLYNNAGKIDLVADVTGYLLPGAPGAPRVETTTIDVGAYSAAGRNIGLPLNFGCVDLATTGELFVDIPLPYGAAVQKVDFRYYDTGLGNMIMVLFEVDTPSSGIPTTSGTLSGSQTASTGTSGYGVATITPTGGDQVSDSVRYYIDAFTLGPGGAGTFHYFCGANVTYARIVS